MPRIKIALFFFLIFSLPKVLCSQSDENALAKSLLKALASKEVSKTSLTVEENETNDLRVKAFGSLVEYSIQNNNPESFIARMSLDDFSNYITKDDAKDDTEDNETKRYRKGYLKEIRSKMNSFPTKISSQLNNGTHYTFISYRYDEVEQTYYTLFRLFTTDGGVNYHDYKLCLIKNKFKFSDIYVYLSGEYLSETFARMYYYSKPVKKLSESFNDKKYKAFNDLNKAVSIYRLGGYKKAYEIINTIKDEDLVKEKFFLIMKSDIASYLSDDSYTKALKELRDIFPNDATIYLTQVDYHINREEYYEAIDLLDKLQDKTQDDFLYYLKANLAFQDKNFDVALEYYKYMTINYPNFIDGYIGHLNVLVTKKDFPDALNVLDAIINAGFNKKDLINFVEEKDESGDNLFKPLVKDKTYRKWKRLK